MIRSELERRTFAPFEGYANAGQPRLWWLTGTNNWNAVCLAGVTGAALAAIEAPAPPGLVRRIGREIRAELPARFTPDGYCSEGIGY